MIEVRWIEINIIWDQSEKVEEMQGYRAMTRKDQEDRQDWEVLGSVSL